jgi:predicted Rossmann fold flavoprotein
MPKKSSRRAVRERLQREARAVVVPSRADVVVVGGGAAGLVASIACAEAGARVVVLERSLSCGQPILATGNGRCNFAPSSIAPERYNDPDFVLDVAGAGWLDDVLGFFRQCGLRWSCEETRLYPRSRQASSVRNVLLARARQAGAILAADREVVTLEAPSKDGTHADARITYRPASTGDADALELSAHAVVLAYGGDGHGITDALGLHPRPLSPVLCPLACKPSRLSALDGRRARAKASLRSTGGRMRWQGEGEVLFRDYGLSGIVVFDASRRAQACDLLELDLVPELTAEELRLVACPQGDGHIAGGCLDGVIDPAIGLLLEQLARTRWTHPARQAPMPASDADALVELVKALPFEVLGPAHPEQAQVMRGGLSNGQFDPTSLAAWEHPWLFACGEALDVDADCGGYNLAWAWKSGLVAGRAAARKVLSC